MLCVNPQDHPGVKVMFAHRQFAYWSIHPILLRLQERYFMPMNLALSKIANCSQAFDVDTRRAILPLFTPLPA
jgi:hypothetical protein